MTKLVPPSLLVSTYVGQAISARLRLGWVIKRGLNGSHTCSHTQIESIIISIQLDFTITAYNLDPTENLQRWTCKLL